MFLERSQRTIFLCNYAWHSVPAGAITKKRGPRDQNVPICFQGQESPIYDEKTKSSTKIPDHCQLPPKKDTCEESAGNKRPVPRKSSKDGFSMLRAAVSPSQHRSHSPTRWNHRRSQVSGHGDNNRHDDNGGTAAECRHQLRAVEPVPARSRQPVPDRLLTLLGGELLPTLLLLNHKSKH